MNKSNSENLFRIGIDIGGTFTDIVILLENGEIFTKKVNSTPEEYSYGAVSGLESLIKEKGLNPKNAKNVVHATTVATNTVIEGKGANTALITTKGFRDILEFRRVRFPELYNLLAQRPPPPCLPCLDDLHGPPDSASVRRRIFFPFSGARV